MSGRADPLPYQALPRVEERTLSMADMPIRRALIAVYDKTGIVEFARALVDEFGIEIISTGGTAKHLKDAGIPVTMVEEVTGFPEMLDGRVKTLHPKIHAGILADRDKPEHMRQLEQHGIKPIDMVVVNLYPFEKTVADPNCTFEQAIEMIDIGGPCMLRAAAKNHKHVLPVYCPTWYTNVLRILRKEPGLKSLDDERRDAAFSVFGTTEEYDAEIWGWLGGKDEVECPLYFVKRFFTEAVLRYGENPHQVSRLTTTFEDFDCASLVRSVVPQRDEFEHTAHAGFSFNNFIDADAALALCAELSRGLPVIKSCTQALRDEPRTSVRAVPAAPDATIANRAFSAPTSHMPAWLLTWTTYGTWLPGDARGFVSRAPRNDGGHAKRNSPESTYDVAQGDLQESARSRMQGIPVLLTEDHATVVLKAIEEAAARHGISLVAMAIMKDHVHVLCQAELDGSEIQKLIKGISSRRLGMEFKLSESPRWWTEGGSKRYIQKGEDLTAAIEYVYAQQGPMVVRSFEAAKNLGGTGVERADGGPRAARTEVRGSSIAAFVKHTNSCGVGVADDPIEAYRRAYLGDPNAAMGGILAVNFPVTAAFAEVVMDSLQRWGKDAGAGAFFVEVLVAPSFEDDAIQVIRTRKKWGEKVRLLAVGPMDVEPDPGELDYKRIAGGMLVQSRDLVGLNENEWKVVTKRKPSDAEMADLRLAWLVAKHTKSNAISICKDGMLIGNGAGQMSRVMSCRIATWLAKENGHADKLAGSVAASDAFFPFRDGPDILMEAGVTAIIQPGGSKRDDETISACDERNVAMIHTGTRHFRH
ncbi:hypothetical protein B7486_16945 [cyanobacterium TDX16]|nr:hypothetical protein B7486_16945 [cyanobacterium TDX16]